MPNPTLELPRWGVDAVRLLAVVCTALAPFLATWTPFAAVVAVVLAVSSVAVARQAVVPAVEVEEVA